MKIRIESERCKGHRNCVRIEPRLFIAGEDGLTRIRGSGDVPEGLREQALLASDNCPEFAIEIESSDTGIVDLTEAA